MRMSSCIRCVDFPCTDVKHDCYLIPDVDLDPNAISIAMIAEAAPANQEDYYYSGANALFAKTTVQAFNDAGVKVTSIREIIDLGCYLTTAVKCGKRAYTIQKNTIEKCSLILKRELALFPNLKVLMLMGDVAIKAVNHIAQRAGEPRVIPAAPTYKIRGQAYFFRGMRVFPSYVQAGPSYFIEKSKRQMIAEDIAAAINLIAHETEHIH